MNQPNPWKRLLPFALLSGFAFFIVLAFVHQHLSLKGEAEMVRHAGTVDPAAPALLPSTTKPFMITEDYTNLMLTARANVNNSWISLDTTLVNMETGEQDDIDIEVSYYTGIDSDGTWAEGSQKQRYYFTGVKRGTYLLSIKTGSDPALKSPVSYSIEARKNVSATENFVIAVLALLAGPLVCGALSIVFEGRRAALSSEVSSDDG
jgi:hypothetical protein